ncbi:hypothetical protein L6164_022339 [Bauhinia variegata]|uniref:Uncharacterized protein n=1 Tax=Bauhinia variegata TaxID=167791 RepID=A0ACB9MG74_BAUVA|nr:hypothetical protein L6164_022339 [Bauhinia variegata]
MGSNAYFSCLLYFFLLTNLASAAGPFISDDTFFFGGSTGRSLLQAKKSCEVDFEHMNYTILTSQCKGPQYPPKVCCGAFKQFACPVAAQISDMQTDCASVMFSYINLYGKYPPGLFANECKEGKEGLDCENVKAADAPGPSSNAQVPAVPHSMILMATAGFSLFLVQFF